MLSAGSGAVSWAQSVRKMDSCGEKTFHGQKLVEV